MSGDLALQLELLARLLLAAVLGAAIGIERETSDQPAGMRTHLLVSVGSATFTVLSIYAFPGSDPGRVAAQIVSGIGFLGAGAILKYGATVRGLTTAASLWAVAAVGMAAGAGAWGAAIGVTVIVIFSLGPLHFVERRLFGASPSRLRVGISASDTEAFGHLLEFLARHEKEIRPLGSTRAEGGAHHMEVEIRGRSGQRTAGLLEELDGINGIEVGSTGPPED